MAPTLDVVANGKIAHCQNKRPNVNRSITDAAGGKLYV